MGKKKGRKKEQRETRGIKMRRRSELSLLRFPGICIMATYARHVVIFHRAHTWERSWNISPGNAVLVTAAIAAPVTSRLINADVVGRSAAG